MVARRAGGSPGPIVGQAIGGPWRNAALRATREFHHGLSVHDEGEELLPGRHQDVLPPVDEIGLRRVGDVADAGVPEQRAAGGALLWHTRIGDISNAPQTYLVDGRQHVLVAAGQQLFAFVMY